MLLHYCVGNDHSHQLTDVYWSFWKQRFVFLRLMRFLPMYDNFRIHWELRFSKMWLGKQQRGKLCWKTEHTSSVKSIVFSIWRLTSLDNFRTTRSTGQLSCCGARQWSFIPSAHAEYKKETVLFSFEQVFSAILADVVAFTCSQRRLYGFEEDLSLKLQQPYSNEPPNIVCSNRLTSMWCIISERIILSICQTPLVIKICYNEALISFLVLLKPAKNCAPLET